MSKKRCFKKSLPSDILLHIDGKVFMKRKKKLSKKNVLRAVISLVVFLIFFVLSENENIGSIEEGSPPAIFSNQAHDDLKKTFLKAIEEAESSIALYIYTLTDKNLIEALNKRAEEGIAVSIVHDPATSERNFSSKIQTTTAHYTGLMHQKILVIDESKVWIGSANFTKESLKVHDNLVVAVSSHHLAQRILKENSQHYFNIGGQDIEFWSFPREGKEGLNRLVELLDTAEKTIKVAMFTWTHPLLTDAVIRAAKRGVQVQIVMDHGQGLGVNAKALQTLKQSKLKPFLSSGDHMLHHKFVWIDDKTLISGSANWTKSAFTKNGDCFVVLHQLNEEQVKKMEEVWRRTITSVARQKNQSSPQPAVLTNKKHLTILRQRPFFITDKILKPVAAFPDFVQQRQYAIACKHSTGMNFPVGPIFQFAVQFV